MMRARAVLRESGRNIASGTTRWTLFSGVLLLTTEALMLSEVVAVRQIVAEAERFQERAGSVLTLTARGSIDGAACDALGAIDGVRAAGAVREAPGALRATALPQSPISLSEATRGFPAVIGADAATSPGVLLGPDVAHALALVEGDTLATPERGVRVAGVYAYPDDGRRRGFGYSAITIASADQAFDECWVDAWPHDPALPAVLLTTMRPGAAAGDGVKPALAQLNGTMGEYFDGAERFEARVTATAPILAAVAGALLAYVSIRIRRLELASALHAGVSRRTLFAILSMETAAWALPAGVATFAVAIVASASAGGADVLPLTVLGARVAAVALLGVGAGMLVALAGVREKHLFRYFRSR